MIDIEYLRSIIDYDPKSGALSWRVKRKSYAGKAQPGAVAGAQDGHGHLVIGIDGHRFMAHRLAWFHHYGRWPQGEIDHIDMDGLNNRLENLREAKSRALQRANQRVRSDSKSGIKGVNKTKSGKFRARICSRTIGIYSTVQEAQAAYMVEAVKLFGDFARAA